MKQNLERIDNMTEAELDTELRKWGVDPEELIQSAFQKVCVLARTQAVEIERLKRNRFEVSRGVTHWESCWRDHYECAMTRIAKLEARLSMYDRKIEGSLP